MMNLVQLQEKLRDFSPQQLATEMQAPTGNVPQYLVLGELQRRKRMEASAMQGQAQESQTTVAQDAVTAAGVPQQGVAGMMQAMAPQTDAAQNTGQAPVQQMARGGLTGVSRNASDYDVLSDPAMMVQARRMGMTPDEYLASLDQRYQEQQFLDTFGAPPRGLDAPQMDSSPSLSMLTDVPTSLSNPEAPLYSPLDRESLPAGLPADLFEDPYAGVADSPSGPADWPRSKRTPNEGPARFSGLTERLGEFAFPNDRTRGNPHRPQVIDTFEDPYAGVIDARSEPTRAPDPQRARDTAIDRRMTSDSTARSFSPSDMSEAQQAEFALLSPEEQTNLLLYGTPTLSNTRTVASEANAMDAIVQESADLYRRSQGAPVDMEAEARRSAEEAAALRDAAGITESLRTQEDKDAAANAALETVLGTVEDRPDTPEAPEAPEAQQADGANPGGSGAAVMSDLEKSLEQDKWLSLAKFGMALMSSQQPTFGGAFGEAGLAATSDFQAAKQRYEDAKLARATLAARRAGGSGSAARMPAGAVNMFDDQIDALRGELAMADPNRQLEITRELSRLTELQQAMQIRYISQYDPALADAMVESYRTGAGSGSGATDVADENASNSTWWNPFD